MSAESEFASAKLVAEALTSSNDGTTLLLARQFLDLIQRVEHCEAEYAADVARLEEMKARSVLSLIGHSALIDAQRALKCFRRALLKEDTAS